MATVYIDNLSYQADAGANLLQVCLSLGFDIPYFCWHPALGAVGACRQCAIKQFKDEHDTKGRLYMACMTPVTDGMRISIENDEVKAFHAGVIEWLMTNHPHDCPVCDEGGECHLQDMTVLSGHTYRRFRFSKRTFRNQDLGPFINHEMNRCITCYRCVRFYNDYAGGTDFAAMASKNHVYFGRHEDGVLENEFSGNLVEICPTGVFTDKTLKEHYTRKWDLQCAPSVCQHCGVGCNTLPGERYGSLRRIYNRYHGEVNGYFLCDRGRYGYGFVNSDMRVRQPQRRQDGEAHALAVPDALQNAAALLQGRRLMGIASPRASLEANALLRRLVGPDAFYAGVAMEEWRCLQAIRRALAQSPARTPSLREVEAADAILILGEDVTQTAARLALALRQAVRQDSFVQAAALKIPTWKDGAVRSAVPETRAPLYIASPFSTKLDDVAQRTFRAGPEEIARLGFAVAHTVDENAPAVSDLAEDDVALAGEIAHRLAAAQRPLIVSGTGCADPALIEAAANVAAALCRRGRPAALSYTMPECNSLGLALLEPRALEEALSDAAQAPVDTLIILENDLYQRASRSQIDALVAGARQILLLDHLHTPTADHADLTLPAATFAEGDGTLISHEGRAQRYFRVFVPDEDTIRPSWRWLADLATSGEHAAPAYSLDQVLAWLARQFPALAPVAGAAPGATFRASGQRIPRQPARYSGRTAMNADRSVHEPKPPTDDDSPLAFSMEGYSGEPPPALITHAWAPRWNSVQAYNKFQQEVGGPLRGGDPGVRLLEPAPLDRFTYFQALPPPGPRNGRWRVVPRHHLFGSDEQSLYTPAIAARAPAPYLAIAPDDAAALGVADGDPVDLIMDGVLQRLPAALLPGLAAGVVAVPRLPGVDIVDSRYGELSRGKP
ncbi:MAG: NADH-quinone oxidoreductase subunit NuoG [Gammaproteobacteria bacterium]